MMRSAILRSFPVPIESSGIVNGKAKLASPARCFPARSASEIRCSSTRHVPKLEPFSRGKLERVLRDPPLIEKVETELADYCSTLEGDDSYSCWRAYFELKDLEKESPKEEVEKLILQTGGVKSLIGCVHGIATMQKEKNTKNGFGLTKQSDTENGGKMHLHVPDGLPKSKVEMEEEEKARMPDSPYTKLLRTKGKFPAWFSPTPDHETD
ncbi:PREDICTED: CCG-binding protein 1 [Tarenaya hassleriana]|uniref:CCG-binding protein 1 n=1 Tax=Tarenaya hassleriana TaxID=28532 RepID=UPI00053C6547|nr:PREDICTED: CCG-binding protein 1 [Tarenaya hassleriana]